MKYVHIQVNPSEDGKVIMIDRTKSARHHVNILLDPLERLIHGCVQHLITPERGQRWATRLKLPRASQSKKFLTFAREGGWRFLVFGSLPSYSFYILSHWLINVIT